MFEFAFLLDIGHDEERQALSRQRAHGFVGPLASDWHLVDAEDLHREVERAGAVVAHAELAEVRLPDHARAKAEQEHVRLIVAATSSDSRQAAIGGARVRQAARVAVASGLAVTARVCNRWRECVEQRQAREGDAAAQRNDRVCHVLRLVDDLELCVVPAVAVVVDRVVGD